jgi:hypothetical protein
MSVAFVHGPYGGVALLRNTRKLRRRTRLNGWFLRFLAPRPAALALLEHRCVDGPIATTESQRRKIRSMRCVA